MTPSGNAKRSRSGASGSARSMASASASVRRFGIYVSLAPFIAAARRLENESAPAGERRGLSASKRRDVRFVHYRSLADGGPGDQNSFQSSLRAVLPLVR